eukprot:Blabericola_migrator_1__6182@NODE_311_length_10068_cov_114_952505_g254_i0_p5_GENE_NODE_311_length_10068_cov_114_952505_g254_i0NODE_311_length_10068_cov_114_952505_g254_i0_p5_ORF_typecomplete_len320_score30_68_NODE_311_length_10068_cov_114_952505_g254_i018842843
MMKRFTWGLIGLTLTNAFQYPSGKSLCVKLGCAAVQDGYTFSPANDLGYLGSGGAVCDKCGTPETLNERLTSFLKNQEGNVLKLASGSLLTEPIRDPAQAKLIDKAGIGNLKKGDSHSIPVVIEGLHVDTHGNLALAKCKPLRPVTPDTPDKVLVRTIGIVGNRNDHWGSLSMDMTTWGHKYEVGHKGLRVKNGESRSAVVLAGALEFNVTANINPKSIAFEIHCTGNKGCPRHGWFAMVQVVCDGASLQSLTEISKQAQAVASQAEAQAQQHANRLAPGIAGVVNRVVRQQPPQQLPPSLPGYVRSVRSGGPRKKHQA